jgi:hypothetical protein
MSTTATETPQYANTALPERPQDGEVIYMDAGGAPQWPLWSRLYDRTAHHEAALVAHLSWSGDFSVAGSAPNNFTVTLGAINAVHLYNSTASVVKSYGGGSITQSKVEGGGGTLGASAQWWYVYAFLNGSSALDFEISTDPPNASRALKSTDNTRVYVGCFPTLSTGVPIPVRASRGRYVYNVGESAVADVSVVAAGSATAYTSVPCSALVPPHARIATLDVRGTLPLAGGATTSAVLVQSYGSTGAMAHVLHNGTGAALDPSGVTFDVVLDSSRRAQYKVAGGANAPLADIYVTGFCE